MYPRSTVDMAILLSDADVLDRETALICDVSVMAIRHWRYGTRRSSPLTGPTCPRCNGRPLDERSYAYLLGLYLGDGHIARGRRDVYALTVACSDAWPGLVTAARLAMSAVMPPTKCALSRRLVAGWSKVRPSTGRAYFLSMVLAGSTSARSCWSHGSKESSRHFLPRLSGA